MNEKWYVLKGEEYIGPYSDEKILEDYRSGKLTNNDFLWTEGEDEWQLITKFLDEIQGTAFKLPPLPIEKRKPQKVLKELPLDIAEKILEEENKTIEKNLQRSKEKQFENKLKIETSFFTWFFCVCSIFLFFGGVYYILQSQNTREYKLQNLKLKDQKDILNYSSNKDEHKLKIGYNKRNFYLSFKEKFNGVVWIDIFSIDGQVLSRNKIHIKAKTKVIKGVAFFNEFRFVKGFDFYEGKYRYKVKAYREDWVTELFNLIYYKIGIKHPILFKRLQQISYGGVLKNYKKETFEGKLKKFKGNQFESKIYPFEDQLKRILVLKQIVKRFEDIFLNRARRVARGSFFRKLEKNI